MNFFNRKNRKIITAVIVIVIVAAMILPMISAYLQ